MISCVPTVFNTFGLQSNPSVIFSSLPLSYVAVTSIPSGLNVCPSTYHILFGVFVTSIVSKLFALTVIGYVSVSVTPFSV